EGGRPAGRGGRGRRGPRRHPVPAGGRARARRSPRAAGGAHRATGGVMSWSAVLVLGVGTYLMRLVGIVLRDRLAMPQRVERYLDLGATALLVALVATATLTERGGFAGRARPAGVRGGAGAPGRPVPVGLRGVRA